MSKNLSSLRSKIGKASAQKGGAYEVHVAKIICRYFGLNEKEWAKYAIKTKRSQDGKQIHGDVQLLPPLLNYWDEAGLGKIEAKNRKSWSLKQVFINPENSDLYKYWEKSNLDTNSDNSIVFFTKAYCPDYILHRQGFNIKKSHLAFHVNGFDLVIVTFQDFASYFWPQFGPEA